MCLMGSLLSFGLRSGAVMARHRRPPLVAAPPVELLFFTPDEWPAGECGAVRVVESGSFAVG
jgi:hypothetical protein